ncbi:MAG: DUF2905 domain-containing protein [Clostridia bacterium]
MGPDSLGRTLMLLGAVIVFLGAIVYFSGRGLPLGNLPGDIYIRRPGFTLYIPITTGIIISLALSLVLSLIFRR